MAVMRVSGYAFSCRRCGHWGGLHRTRGQALQEEIDHYRPLIQEDCTCPITACAPTHLTGCENSLPTPTGAG